MRVLILTGLLLFNTSWATELYEVEERSWPSVACSETFNLLMHPINLCVPFSSVSQITVIQSEPVASEIVFHKGGSLIILQQPADMVFGKPVVELNSAGYLGESTQSVFNALFNQPVESSSLAQIIGLPGGALIKFEDDQVVAYWVDSPAGEDALYIYREPETQSPMLVFGEWDDESMANLLSRISF